MRSNWQIASLFGIPIYIDSSWFIVLALVTIINAGDVNASGIVGDRPIWGWIAGLILALLLFISVLLHELGHSLVARSQGIIVNSITLFLFGGIAAIDRESKTPTQALLVAIAGPLVSISLCGLFFSIAPFVTDSSLTEFIVADLARINLVLALFNLIPGLPLDGGQALKAIVWKVSGDRFTGIRWAAASGKLIGLLAIALGIFTFLLLGEFSATWLVLIGWFVFRNANAYDRLTQLQQTILKLTAADAMTREYKVVDANLTLSDFAKEYILSEVSQPMPYFAVSEGRYRGLIQVSDLQAIERSEWETKMLVDIAHPLGDIAAVAEKTSLVEVIQKLEKISDRRITVLSPAGAVAGVVDRGDIVRAIAKAENLAIPETEIKRIKAEGTYPSNLPLVKICANLDSLS
jgi:Zn-dependent protease/CBS domain-containing protein